MSTDPTLIDETGPAPARAPMIDLTKAHGAARAYLVHCDRDGTGELSAASVRAVTDPVRGIGATGIIRLVLSSVLGKSGPAWFVSAISPSGGPAVVSTGVLRVAAAYLHTSGEVSAGEGDTIALLSDAGRHYVTYRDGQYGITVGAWRGLGGTKTLDEGFNATVAVSGLDEPRPGLQLDVGATHTIVALESADELAGLDLSAPTRVEPATDGTGSLAFVVPLGERDVEVIGAGGAVTGSERIGAAQVRLATADGAELLGDDYAAAAATVAVRHWLGAEAAAEWVVLTPGGSQRVIVHPSRSVEVAEEIVFPATIAWKAQPAQPVQQA
ncbi:hypothetical protein [Pseudactinotalea sp. HY158]|uniref:hypothetical protein n=1 Tax=Pseudactinotalea sp. HY158 TaxID=2654547 RepID=UPI00129C6561|nr:hypothetical protein [Pseudactinotalea sp. HY158]QGH69851.1 hypothetical protein GCE65_10295 [Pseudactinotalea sp. HY158]